MPRRRKTISPKMRARIFERHHGVCHICGGKIMPGQAWEVSHDIPLELGGADDETNMMPAHERPCHKMLTATVDVPRIRQAQRRERKHLGAKRSRWQWDTGFRPRPARQIEDE